MESEYKISNYQLGKEMHSKVYSIRDNISGKEYIVKIYEDSTIIYYKNESNILDILNSNNLEQEKAFFIMYKNMHYNPDMFEIPKEVKGFNLEFLFYDYLSKLSLLDYINYFNDDKKEIYAKYLCYKLIKAIEKLQTSNICHNKIGISNIMFDDNYNPKIIHFSEANIIKNTSDINKDIFGLGQILAKILTLGKFSSINYDKNKKVYFIYYKNQGKKTFIEESKFWMMIKSIYNIYVPEKFIEFFHIIIKAKKLKEIININELLKTEWLIDLNNEIQKYEDNFKKDFQELYKTIIEDYIKTNQINIDINNILDENKEESISLLKNSMLIFPSKKITNYSRHQNKNKTSEISGVGGMIIPNEKEAFSSVGGNILRMKKEKYENFDKDYNNEINKVEDKTYKKKKNKEIEEKEDKIDLNFINLENDHNKELMNINNKISDKIEFSKQNAFIHSLKEDDLIKKKQAHSSLISFNELYEKEKNSIRDKHEENMMKIENFNEEINNKNYHEENNLVISNEFLENKKHNKNNYILRSQKKEEFIKHNKINAKEENFFMPRKDDFNYLKINIKNNENKDINKALNNLMKKLKDKIKQKYEQNGISVIFDEEKDNSFNIFYLIEPPVYINFDNIEFLDDDFEKKIKNFQKFEIKVELIEGDKNMFSINKINEYYLIFKGISVNKEDFYEQINILKEIVKDLYI